MSKKNTQLSWVIGKIKHRIPMLGLLVLSCMGAAFFSVYFALGTKGIINAATAKDGEMFKIACLKQFGIILGIVICNLLTRYFREKLNAELDRDWKKTLIHDLLNSDYSAVSNYHSSELVNRLNNDVGTLDGAIVNLLPQLASMLTRLLCALSFLASMSPWFTVVLLVLGGFVVLVTGFLRKRLKGLHKRVSEANGRVSAIMQETLEKLLIVQAMDISDEIERRTVLRLDERFAIVKKRMNISLASHTCTNILFLAAGFVSLVWCAAGLLTGTMDFGTMTAVTQLVNQLQHPFVNLSGVIPQYIAALAALDRLYELAQLPGTTDLREESVTELYGMMDGIAAEDLVFAYDRDKILDGANFSLQKGDFCAVTGPSGIGKSTILKLLLGIYPPQSGQLYLQCGDQKIPIDRRTRHLFNYVPQGNLLFSGTIRENLLVAKPNASDDEVNQAIYVSTMDEYLSQLPNGLDTELGESGAGLSEGQAQRLAIGRAILGGAPIVLLDECTSALDNRTEKLILQRLNELTNKTFIAVTHRPAAEEICSCKLMMRDGKVCVSKSTDA